MEPPPSRDSRSLPRASPRSNPRYAGGRHDDRYMEGNNSHNSGRGGSRGQGQVPNGFKPKGRTPEKYEMRSDSKRELKEDSDEDDDDWC